VTVVLAYIGAFTICVVALGIVVWGSSRPAVRLDRAHYMAPCWQQPGKQEWHLRCALLHPLRFLRSRGPVKWRPS
jgi:hypothetical protein